MWTTFLRSDQIDGIKTFVQRPDLALINNWECYKSGGAQGPDWDGLKFDPSNPIVYPPCFWNLGVTAIKPP